MIGNGQEKEERLLGEWLERSFSRFQQNQNTQTKMLGANKSFDSQLRFVRLETLNTRDCRIDNICFLPSGVPAMSVVEVACKFAFDRDDCSYGTVRWMDSTKFATFT